MITAWSSGTGSAGIIGSVSWAGLLGIGFLPRDTMRLMLIVPAIQAATFWFLLRSPKQDIVENSVKNIATIEANSNNNNNNNTDVQENMRSNSEGKLNGFKAKLKFVPKLAGFITPLVIVFIFEYICVSGLVIKLFTKLLLI